MARVARVVVPGIPHHVTQRGSRGQATFLDEDDYRAYLDMAAESCARHGVEVWAYCLMPNHVHLIAVPREADGLGRALGQSFRRYSRRFNARTGSRGHLWQGRFASVAMDERHLMAAARYVELNPVRARRVDRPEAYRWSSAAAHLAGRDDALVTAAALNELVDDWRAFLDGGLPEADAETLRRHERTGWPLGGPDFVAGLEAALDRTFGPRKRGRKPNTDAKPATDRRGGEKT